LAIHLENSIKYSENPQLAENLLLEASTLADTADNGN